jgi:Mg-chelatase subunit ChlD
LYGPDLTDIDATRLFVTEPSLGRVQVFTGRGLHVGTIRDAATPWDVACSNDRVYVTDAASRRVLVFDYEGNRVGAWGVAGSPTGDLGLPGAVAVTDNFDSPKRNATVVVADREGNSLTWLDDEGRHLHTVAVRIGAASLPPLDISLADHELPDWVYVATDAGVIRVSESGMQPAAELLTSGGGPTGPVQAIAAFRNEGQQAMAPDDWSVLYVAQPSGPRLRRYLHPRITRGAALRRTCPWVDEEPTPSRPWRIAANDLGQVFVANSNGVVLKYDEDGQPSKYAEAGDIDDFGVDDAGTLYLNTHSHFVQLSADGLVVGSAPRGRIDERRAWWQEYVCTPAGYGIQGSLDVRPTDGRVDMVSVGPMLVQVSLWAVSLQHHYARSSDDWRLAFRRIWLEQGAGEPSYYKASLLTDVVSGESSDDAFVVERLAGYVHPVTGMQTAGGIVGQPWSVPGRPDRSVRGPEGGLYVLTAEGFIWQLDGAGQVTAGWDAAGAPNGPRARLVDLAAVGERVYALDQEGRRVLVFEPAGAGPPAPTPQLPPPCSVETDKDASSNVVPLASPVTVTLQVDGACGRMSAESDILMLLSPWRTSWTKDNYERAAEAFLDQIDFTRDRVALMAMDETAQVLAPYTSDADAIRSALPSVLREGSFEPDSQPIDLARDYVAQNARPGVNRIILLVTELLLTCDDCIVAAERLRQDGVRTIVVTNSVVGGFAPAAMAYQLEDVFFAPDVETLRAVYEQIGTQVSARVLARELVVSDQVPENMTYVPGSALPPAVWDETDRTLSWRATDVSFGGWSASYRLEPQSLGSWPTNVYARLEFVDGFGNRGAASFPVPEVLVVAPPTATPTLTPTEVATATATETPKPTATAQAPQLFVPIALAERCVSTAGSDVVLVIDASTSMRETTPAGRLRIDAARDAARLLLALLHLGQRDQAAVVSFSAVPTVHQTLSGSQSDLEQAVARIVTSQSSRLDLAIEAAHAELLSPRHRSENNSVIVLLTDGEANPEPITTAVQRAAEAKADGIIVFSIGIGDAVEAGALVHIASSASHYYHAPTGDDLADVYRRIAARMPCPAADLWRVH